jgi:hypothetical protein
MHGAGKSRISPLGFALGSFMIAAGTAEPGLFRLALLGICALIAVSLLVRASRSGNF